VTWPSDDTLVSLAAYGLAGSMFDTPSGPFSPDDWHHLLATAGQHGIVGILAAAAHSGEVRLSPAQSEELSVVEREAAGLALLVEQQVVRTSGLLAAAGLAHRVLGGPARGRLGYRNLGYRTFTEATMLVEPAAVELLGPLGGGTPGVAGPEAPGAPGGAPAPVGLSAPAAVTAGPAAATSPSSSSSSVARRQRVRLEVAAIGGAAGEVSISVGQMADPPTLLVLADRPVPTGSIEEHLVLACIEAAATAGRPGLDLVLRRDIVELAMFPAIDADRVRLVCDVWGVTDLVTHELAVTWRYFELADRTPLSVWAFRGDAPAGGARGRRPGSVMGRMVDRLAPGAPGPRTARRVQ
jgi:putative nucleotidyltransferase-like protein